MHIRNVRIYDVPCAHTLRGKQLHNPLCTVSCYAARCVYLHTLFSSIFRLSSSFLSSTSSLVRKHENTRIRMHTDVFCLTCSILLMDFGRVSGEERGVETGKTVVNVGGSALKCFLSRKSVERPRDSYVYGSQESFTKHLCVGKVSTGMSIEINNLIARSSILDKLCNRKMK